MRTWKHIIWYGNGIQIKSTQDFHVLVLLALSYYCCRSSFLRNSIAVYELWFFPVIFQKNCQERIKWIVIVYVVNFSFLYVYQKHIMLLINIKKRSFGLSNLSFTWWKWINSKTTQTQNPGNQTPCHSSFSNGIICDPHRGSFAVK